MTARTTDDETLDAARQAGEIEALTRQVARLRAALDQVLPLAKTYAGIEPAHGGPAADRFVVDPENPDAQVLPEILEAEQALFSTGAVVMPRAEGAGFDELEFEDFVETEDDDESGLATPDTVEALLLAAANALRTLNAYRIAGQEPSDEQKDAYAKAIGALAHRLRLAGTADLLDGPPPVPREPATPAAEATADEDLLGGETPVC